MDRNKKTAVFGIYPSLEAANNATDVLVKGGFPSSDISALLPDNLGSRPIGTAKSTKAPEGAAAGGGSGAVLGGAIGFWPASVPSQFPESVRSSPLARSWPRSQVLALAQL